MFFLCFFLLVFPGLLRFFQFLWFPGFLGLFYIRFFQSCFSGLHIPLDPFTKVSLVYLISGLHILLVLFTKVSLVYLISGLHILLVPFTKVSLVLYLRLILVVSLVNPVLVLNPGYIQSRKLLNEFANPFI